MEALERVELAERATTGPNKLSGGEQQRVAIARALVRKPAVVLADEPTGALDTDTGEHVIEILKEATVGAGSCLVLVTHDSQLASKMGRVLELKNGKLIPYGTEHLYLG
jgi:putative ABC transport system ATP-binding protein